MRNGSACSIYPHTQNCQTLSARIIKRRGMNFVGSTIIYAIMQTIGMVNDHEVGCFRYNKL
ncbi:DNA-3-methyladenine glycosylase I [Patescibacteria group bacterium]|nr:DNA-3-methyladenine glycosylase I [Patescibacteria group bacterium]